MTDTTNPFAAAVDSAISHQDPGDSATTGTDNPYSSAVDSAIRGQSATIRNNVYNAMPQNPAQVAEHSQLADQLGIPIQSVQANPTVAKQRAAMQNMDAQKVIYNHPYLADFLTDPTNAAQVSANGDVPNLANLEASVRNVPSPAGASAPPDLEQTLVPLPDAKPTLRDRLHDLVAGWIGGPTAEQEHQGQSAAEANAILAARQANPDLVPKPNATPAEIAKLNDLAWQQSNAALGGASRTPQIAAEHAVSSATFGLVSPVVPTQSHSTAESVAGGAGALAGFFGGPVQAAKALMELSPAATAALTTNPGDAWALSLLKNVVQQSATLAAASGAQQAGSSVLDSHSVEEGVKSELQAVKSGAETGALFGAAGKLLPDNTIAQWVARFGGVSAMQDMMNGQTPWDDRSAGQKVFDYGQNAFFTAHGGGRSDGGWFSNDPTVREGVEKANQAADAIKAGESMQAFSTAAQNTKLRDLNPAAFTKFLETTGADKEVYADPQVLMGALHQSGIPLEELQQKAPEVYQQLNEGLHTNGFVRIPLPEYGSTFATPELDQSLLPHLHTDPDAMTYAQGQEHLANQQSEMTQQAQDIVNRQQADTERDRQLAAINAETRQQFDATGRFPAAVTSKYADLRTQFIDTQAQKMGISPAELDKMMPLKVTGESLAMEGLNQPERRSEMRLRNDDLEKPFEHMSPDEVKETIARLRESVGKNELTGLPSKDAWKAKEAEGLLGTHKASIDVDSLKWVNDTMGHHMGDVLLGHVGDALGQVGINAHHVSGDEFYAHHDDPVFLDKQLQAARDILKTKEIEGSGYHMKGADFSYGISDNLKDAEHGLHQQKSDREAAGERSARGDTPPGAIRTAGKLDRRAATQGDGNAAGSAQSEGRSPGILERIKNLFFRSADQSGRLNQAMRVHPELMALVNRTLADTQNTHDKVAVGDVDPKLAEIAKANGLNIDGYTHSVDTSAIRHILKSHGNAESETQRGNVAITKEDIAQIPSIFSSPDKVVLGLTNNIGNDMIGYLKRLPDGSTLYLEEVRTGKKELAAQSLRKYPPTTPDNSIETALRHTRSEPTSGGKVSIVPVSNDVNNLDQGNRGFYNPATGEMGLLKDADLSTALHELGHHFLESMHTLAEHPNAPEGIKGDFDTLLQHFKVKGDTPEARMVDWSGRTLDEKRDGHEQFAEDFEKYLFDGKAPTPELQSMFSRFRSWLMSVYQNLRGELSPEVKSVFDRMFASQETINEAERVRGYLIPDLPAEHGELIDQYKALGKEATEQAIADMQARSLRDMQWLSNAKSKAMRELQRSAKDERATIKEAVTKEVMEQPVNQARTWLAKGEMRDHEGNLIKAEKGFKLNTNGLRQMFPKDSLTPLDLNELRGMTSEDGLHPDMVADMFGFDSGRTLIGALTHGEKPADQIKGMTDQRMLERHGDLVDPISIERAAEAAIHNDARARMMATGLKMFAKSPMSAIEINKAAKVAADTAIAAKKVGDLRPAQYSAAETKANRELLKLAPKDPAGAAAAQRAALLNNRLFKSASEAVAEVRAIPTYVKRLTSVTTLKKIAPEERGLILGLLKNYDFRTNPTDEPTRGQKNLQQWIDAQTAAGYMPTVSPDALNAQPRTHFRDMTVEQIRGLRDTLKSLEFQGKNANKLDILGDKVDKREYIDTHLIPKLKEAGENYPLGDILDHPENQEKGPIAAALAKVTGWMSAGHENTLPPAHRAMMLDRQEINGPFQESLINPMMDAAVHEARMNKAVTDKANAGAASLGKDWQKSRYEMVPNTVLIDAQATRETGKPVYLKITRDNLGAMLVHAGNESNFDKLCKGREWDPATVMKFILDNINAKDLEMANRVWDMAGMHWEAQVKQAERLGAILPPKVEARAFDTPVGRATGGYAPLRYDPLRSKQAAKAEQASEVNIHDNMRSAGTYMDRQSTISGSLHARNDGYTDVVDLRLQRIQDAIREDIHDLAFREPIINGNKILNDEPFRTAFKLAHGPAEYKALTQYYDQFVNSAQVDKAADWLDAAIKYTRTGMVSNAIGFRATTVLKHGLAAAIKSVGSFVGGGEKYFLKRLASMVTDHDNQVATAMQNSDEIYTRLLQFDRDYTAAMGNLLDPESLNAKMHRFGHFAVAWFDQLTAVPTFHAAYDRAVTEGIPERQGGTGEPMTDVQAKAYANNVVRMAHGGSTDATRSNLMNSKSESVKLLTTMYQFMNNTYGQGANTISALRTPGIGKPEVLAKAFMQQIVPALVTAFVTKGIWDKKDDIGKWLAEAIGDEAVTALPGGASLLAIAKDQNHAGQLAPMAFAESVVQPTKDLWKISHGEHASKPIQDTANAVGMAFHLSGMGQAGKTLQYADDMRTGKEKPADALEALQGLTVGVHHPKK